MSFTYVCHKVYVKRQRIAGILLPQTAGKAVQCTFHPSTVVFCQTKR